MRGNEGTDSRRGPACFPGGSTLHCAQDALRQGVKLRAADVGIGLTRVQSQATTPEVQHSGWNGLLT